MKVGVSWHETLGPRTVNFNNTITILFPIGYKWHAFYFAFSAEEICRYPFSCVILQCIQGVSAWESLSDAWEKVLQIKERINFVLSHSTSGFRIVLLSCQSLSAQAME